MDDNVNIQVLYEGDTFSVYRFEEEDGEVAIDVNLFDTITLHFVKEEWNEFLEVLHSLQAEK
jgi:hypothetical protein